MAGLGVPCGVLGLGMYLPCSGLCRPWLVLAMYWAMRPLACAILYQVVVHWDVLPLACIRRVVGRVALGECYSLPGCATLDMYLSCTGLCGPWRVLLFTGLCDPCRVLFVSWVVQHLTGSCSFTGLCGPWRVVLGYSVCAVPENQS